VDSYLYAVYDPNGGVEGGIAPFDPKLTPLVEGQRKEADPTKRRALVRQACEYIADQCWNLAIFRDVGYSVWSPKVKGFYQLWGSANDDWAKNIWLAQ
jgi:ABC-type transport system substrate-binding protein